MRSSISICSNRATISQADIEARVLHALSEHLMEPELVRAFCKELTAEMNRLRAEAGAQRASKAAELERVKRDHAKLVDAIVAGVSPLQVKDRMNTLDARRQQLEAELSASPSPAPIRFHPGMAEVYRQKVHALVEGLTDPAKNLEVTEAIRALVNRIVLTPELEDGHKRPRLVVDLEGALAAILHLAAGAKMAATAIQVVDRLTAEAATGGATSPDDNETAPLRRGSPNAKEPPVLSDGGSSKTMVKLVAGAGFGFDRTAGRTG